MKKLITLFALIVFNISLSAQSSCNCKTELEFVYEQMQTMASFKSQIKGQKIDEFERAYLEISKKVTTSMDILECYTQMNLLLSGVKDKHAGVYGTRPDYSYEDTLDTAFIASYQSTLEFQEFPRVDMDLSALRTDLSQKSVNDIEGIYNIGSSMKVGVYRVADSDSLVGVMLESKLGIWAPGQIYAYLNATDIPNRYDIVAYGQVHKNLIFYKGHLVSNGILMGNVIKEGLRENHIHVDRKAREAYTLLHLQEDIQYIWLDSFSRFGNAGKRDALVEQIKNELTASHLIVDLRNNSGGASKISLPIVKAIRKSGVKVYVLTNFASGSNAEQTTVRLRNIKTTIHLGQTTYGAIAYGLNYGTTHESPSGQFYFAPTDMRFNHFLRYEEVGVKPMIELKPDQDWIEQTIEIIAEQDL